MSSRTAREHVEGLERSRVRLTGDGERFAGYGVAGLPFTLGHVLALQRITASTIGPPFTSVWHRAPDGRWTFYTDVEPARSSPRYFGAALHHVICADIELEWTRPDTLAVCVPGHQVEWAIRIESPPVTRLLRGVAGAIPPPAFRSERFLERWGRTAGRMLQTGPLKLAGRAPNGQRFRLSPQRLWTIGASAAVIRGRDAGPLGSVGVPLSLGDYQLPDRGIFVAGHAWYETYDPARHRPPVAGRPARVAVVR